MLHTMVTMVHFYKVYKGKAPDKQRHSGHALKLRALSKLKQTNLNKLKARNDTNVGPDCKFIFILHF